MKCHIQCFRESRFLIVLAAYAMSFYKEHTIHTTEDMCNNMICHIKTVVPIPITAMTGKGATHSLSENLKKTISVKISFTNIPLFT